jgi:beta-lactamase regulating signal transducer with metallopeptidase domain
MNALPVAETLRPLGYALLMTLWYGTALALLVACLFRTRHGASPQRRHGIALTSLLLTVAAAGATWAFLSFPPAAGQPSVALPQPATQSGAMASIAAGVSRLAPTEALPGEHPASWPGWLAVAWLAAVMLLALRLSAGLFMTWWIRRRAVRLSTGPVAESVARLSKPVGLRQSVDVCESPALECPIAVGWRRPKLIVPVGIDVTLDQSRLEPVIAHELEHLRRRDQWSALVQAIADGFLFFCPGARWMSRQVREAREQQCDDAAIRVCGDRAAYATALGVLASRATGNWANAVMGDQAPSLVRRIKRILKGDTMEPLSRGQWLSVVTGFTVTIVTGAMVFGVSLEAARAAELIAKNRAAGPQGTIGGAPVPTGMVPEQAGAPIRVLRATGDGQFCFSRVGVRNISEKAVNSITFIGVVEHARRTEPAIVVRSTPVPVSLEPGATIELSVALLPIVELLQWKAEKGYVAQATLGLVEVGFGDGHRWVMTPPSDAVTEDDVFQKPKPTVSRALLSGPHYVGPAGAPCRDDRGMAYSEGAMVRIKGETGVAVCTKSGWAEQKSVNSEQRLWVFISQGSNPDLHAGVEVMTEPYSRSPYACMRATPVGDPAEGEFKVCLRSWMEAGRARVVVFLARRADDTHTKDLDTFLLADGESHAVTGTANVGAVGMIVTASTRTKKAQTVLSKDN